jgi:hypothetical protein
MPVFLMERLQTLFTVERLSACFPELGNGVQIYLFGEGY